MHNVDTMNICMKEFGSQKHIIDKMTVMRTWTIFTDCVRGYSSTCAMIVHTRADQLLLITAFDGFTQNFAFTLQAYWKFA